MEFLPGSCCAEPRELRSLRPQPCVAVVRSAQRPSTDSRRADLTGRGRLDSVLDRFTFSCHHKELQVSLSHVFKVLTMHVDIVLRDLMYDRLQRLRVSKDINVTNSQ